jgi:hypothetical protein
MKSTF